MQDNKRPEVGQIQIADDVIATIAGVAAYEVEGVTFGADTPKLIGRRNFAKGVKVKMSDGKVVVDITLTIRFGYKIMAVCEEVQSRVKSALETMVGMQVREVNVHINGIQFTAKKAAR